MGSQKDAWEEAENVLIVWEMLCNIIQACQARAQPITVLYLGEESIYIDMLSRRACLTCMGIPRWCCHPPICSCSIWPHFDFLPTDVLTRLSFAQSEPKLQFMTLEQATITF